MKKFKEIFTILPTPKKFGFRLVSSQISDGMISDHDYGFFKTEAQAHGAIERKARLINGKVTVQS